MHLQQMPNNLIFVILSKKRKGINTGMFYHAGLKCFKLRVLLHLGQLMDDFQTGFRHQCIFIILFFNIFFTVHKFLKF